MNDGNNRICLSTDQRFVEAWNNGRRCITAAVTLHGLHGAVGLCLNYLRSWSGFEPSIDKELQAAMDRADSHLQEMAANGPPLA